MRGPDHPGAGPPVLPEAADLAADILAGLRQVPGDLLDPVTRLHLDRVRAAAEALVNLLCQGRARPAAVGLTRLHDVLDLAGPEAAAELLLRLDADLTEARQSLATALETRDLAALRSQAHVLVSVAGTIGADQVLEMAETLQTAARDGAEGAAFACAQTLIAPLDRLIGRIRAERLAG